MDKSNFLKIVLAQLNLTVGDIGVNTNKIIESICNAQKLGADIILFPELSISSYPPEDLLLKPDFHEQIKKALVKICNSVGDIHVLIGYPLKKNQSIYNACSLIYDKKIKTTYFKQSLPNYGVFDEKRYFTEGNKVKVFCIKGVKAAITICEDIWTQEPLDELKRQNVKILFNINASPYHINKQKQREAIITKKAIKSNINIVYSNLVGGQDELIFDGNSMIINNEGTVVFRAPAFKEGDFHFNLDLNKKNIAPNVLKNTSNEENIYNAIVLGVKDYIKKNCFNGVILGLSGGIDSALTAAIAVDALGHENVEALIMPSRYTSKNSIDYAIKQANILGIKYEIISIEPSFYAFIESLKNIFKELSADITEENIQARCRGILLMAVSNKTGKIVLTTGNKSEMSVGYATLYGDMAGGFAPLKDVWKTLVYKLSLWRNTIKTVIPEEVIQRPPTAELRDGQLDEDSLPTYEILDPILQNYIEKNNSKEQLITKGFNKNIVNKIIRMVDKNEYKRHQAALGVRISELAFGKDRRMPITSSYEEKNN